MSKHTIILRSNSDSRDYFVIVGYHEVGLTPGLYCMVFNYPVESGVEDQWAFNSFFVPSKEPRIYPNCFDVELGQFGIVLPDFLKKALAQDVDERVTGTQCEWSEDGSFEQLS